MIFMNGYPINKKPHLIPKGFFPFYQKKRNLSRDKKRDAVNSQNPIKDGHCPAFCNPHLNVRNTLYQLLVFETLIPHALKFFFAFFS